MEERQESHVLWLTLLKRTTGQDSYLIHKAWVYCSHFKQIQTQAFPSHLQAEKPWLPSIKYSEHGTRATLWCNQLLKSVTALSQYSKCHIVQKVGNIHTNTCTHMHKLTSTQMHTHKHTHMHTHTYTHIHIHTHTTTTPKRHSSVNHSSQAGNVDRPISSFTVLEVWRCKTCFRMLTPTATYLSLRHLNIWGTHKTARWHLFAYYMII